MLETNVDSNQSLVISKHLILKVLMILWGVTILFLVLADIFINHYEWINHGAIQRLVNITRDDGLPNWFSSIQLLSISIVVWIICLVTRFSVPALNNNKLNVWSWAFIALFFTYLAVDDGSKNA